MKQISTREAINYLNNLNDLGLKQVALSLLAHPENREYIVKVALEWDKMYSFKK